MGKSELFRKYYNRLALIGCCKSAVLALIAAFIADFVAAIIVFAAKASLSTVLIVCLGTFAAVFVIALPIFYFSYFRPTTAMIAHLLDRLGLEERIVTMCEFEKDDSYIAMLQREDAKNKLKNVNAKNLRFNISRVAVILLAISFCLGTSMTAVSVYASMLPDKPGSSISGSQNGEDGKDKDGKGGEDGSDENEDPTEEEDPLAEYVTVTYLVRDEIGGHIQGDTVQKIKKGSDAKPVKAIADEGYEFYVWSDDYIYSERYDWEVTEDLTVEAIFVPEEEAGDGDGEGDENNGDDAGHGSAGDKNNQGGQGGLGGLGQGEHGQNKPDNSGGHGQAASGQGSGNQGQGGLGNIGGDGLGVEGGGGSDGEGLGAEGGGEGEGEGGDANGDGKGGEGEGEGEGGDGQGQGEGQGSGNGSGSGDGSGEGDGNGSGSATDPDNAHSGIGEGEPPIGDGELETDYVGGGDNNHNGQGGTGNVDGGGLSSESQKNNTVIDGNTNYQEGMEGESSQENLQNDQSIPPELKDLIDKYLNGLKP